MSGVEQFVEIPPGAGPGAIGRRLAGSGVVRDQLSFRIGAVPGAGRRAGSRPASIASIAR